MFLLIIFPTVSSETSFLASPPGHLTSVPGLRVDCRTGGRQNVCSQESFREEYLPNSLAEVGLRRALKGTDEVTREFKGWHLHSDRKAIEPPWFLSLKTTVGSRAWVEKVPEEPFLKTWACLKIRRMFEGCELPFQLGGVVWGWTEELNHKASKWQCMISKATTSSLTVFSHDCNWHSMWSVYFNGIIFPNMSLR